ncbi:winged helix-turn-helix transcriptional regulator [archaeon]|nr:winged helix-turn-helix transcriptional regulator [archaeon]
MSLENDVLRTLKKKRSASMHEIAEELGIKTGDVKGVLNRLRVAGLLIET